MIQQRIYIKIAQKCLCAQNAMPISQKCQKIKNIS